MLTKTMLARFLSRGRERARLLCLGLCVGYAGACSLPRSSTPGQESARRVERPIPQIGKQTAPVSVAATLNSQTCELELSFAAAASDVTVDVYGISGLEVTSNARPAEGLTVQQGQTLVYTVSYADAPAGSRLGVGVRGEFFGSVRARAVSFDVGPPPVSKRQADDSVTIIDGRRVRVMPAR